MPNGGSGVSQGVEISMSIRTDVSYMLVQSCNSVKFEAKSRSP